MLVVAIGLAAVAAGVYVNVIDTASPSSSQIGSQDLDSAQLTILNVIAQDIEAQQANRIRIQVTAGDEPVRINDTLIRLQTEDGVDNLYYTDSE